MTSAGSWRALSPTERIQASKETYIGYAARIASPVDPDALATAYEAIYRSYPQFAARLVTGDGAAAGPVFAESSARPEIGIRAGNPDEPLTGVEVDQERTLSALSVVRDGDEASVCLVVHHSIADAHHAIEVLAALWSCYTDVVKGVRVDLPRHPFPSSLEYLLAERGIRAKAAASGSVSPLPSPPVSQAAPVVRHVVSHRLSAAQGTALAELGHREHVTINSLLAGAILLAEAEIRDLPLTDLVYRYTVNLRSRLTPPVGPTEGTNVLGGAGFRVTSDLKPDAVAIGRAIGEQLRAGLADGSIQRSLLDMLSQPAPSQPAPSQPAPSQPAPSQPAPDAKPWNPSLAVPVVSMMNWGLVPPMRTPDDLRVTSFFSASRIRDVVALGGYVVSTFDGRIGIDLAWPQGDPQLSRRLGCLRERLSRLTCDL